MEMLLEITGWMHYVGLAAWVVLVGGLVVITVGELVQEHTRAGNPTGAA